MFQPRSWRAYERDDAIKDALGQDFSAAYLKLKNAEWDTFCAQFTPWEHATTLDI